MKKIQYISAMLVALGLPCCSVGAADVSYTSVVNGRIVSVSAVGATVETGDVLATVESLAGPMPAVRASSKGVVKTVLVQEGQQVQQGHAVIVIEEK